MQELFVHMPVPISEYTLDFASKILLHEPHPDVHFLFLTPDFWDCIFVILSKILKELPDLYKGK